MKRFRKTFIFAALISLFYCVSLIQSTYAKYVTAATGTTNLTTAKWNIIVNNQDVTSNSNFSTSIVPTFNGTTNIKSGVIAPTATGSFDVTLDMSQVEVSVEYTITAAISNSNTVTDLKIVSYTIDNVETAYTGSISDQVLLNSADKTVTITFNVEWVEDASDGAVMNNLQDTQAAANGVAAVDVNINFVQIR